MKTDSTHGRTEQINGIEMYYEIRGQRRAARNTARIQRRGQQLGTVPERAGQRVPANHTGHARTRTNDRSNDEVYVSAICARRVCSARPAWRRKIKGHRIERRRQNSASHGYRATRVVWKHGLVSAAPYFPRRPAPSCVRRVLTIEPTKSGNSCGNGISRAMRVRAI